MTELEMAPKGLAGVVVESTVLSRVDGVKGELTYLGYNVDELVNCSFEEVVHLFLFGALPNKGQLEELTAKLVAHRAIPQPVQDYISKAPQDRPMATLRSGVSMLSGYLNDLENMTEQSMKDNAVALVSKVATVAAAITRVRSGHDIVEPREDLSHAANFLYMCTGEVPNDIVTETMNLALILHADHSFNASTFTARVVASTQSDMISAVCAAIGSLKGPLHGGANTAVMKTLIEIGELENVEPWLDVALAEKRKIMGFGHRVYRVFDPRARHLKRISEEWGKRVGNVKWFEMSARLEQLMLEKKNINPNVDFYSASTYYAMGIEPDMYTPIFAVSRILGWTAHVVEQLSDNRIFRPKANYIGGEGKTFTAIENR
jgi:citrate synthase